MNRDRMRHHVVAFVADLLDIVPERIDPATPLEFLGVDSATTLVLAAELSTLLDREVSPVEVFEYRTIEALAGHLVPAR